MTGKTGNLRIYVVYLLSGFVALGYQVAWFRLFPDWFGSTSLSFALVLCNFIGGLGAGALASAPLARGLARLSGLTDPLRLYGLIEGLVAVAAALTLAAGWLPAGLWGDFPYHLSGGVWAPDAAYRAGQLAVAVTCVFLPCFLMGTTFPLLCRAFVDAPGGARFPSALYGWNTLGACLGVLACQFILLPTIGHLATFRLILGLNAALAAYLLAAGRGDLPAAEVAPAKDPAPDRGGASAPPGWLLACATVSGLLSGALEGDMFRRIGLVVSTSPGALGPAISFWAILAIFLASTLAWRAKWLRLPHVKVAAVAAVACQYAAWRLMYPVVVGRLEGRYAVSEKTVAMINNFPDGYLELFGFVGLCVFVPYFLVSLLLPWACNQAQARGSHLGLAYGANTLAFCLGLVGFTLLAPMVNVFYSLKLAPVLMACGAGLLLSLSESRAVRWWQPAAGVAAFLAGCVLTPAGFDRDYVMPESPQARYPVSALRGNGASTTYVVHAPDGAYLYFGNTSMSGTVLPSQVYMRLMAHVPLLLQASPASALVICFGVGNTASAIATHDGIRRLDVVDLNRNVFETAPEFAATNREVYRDPRVRLVNDDGRSFLRLSRERWDLITSEPPPPMQAGVYRLYSREYYADVLAHLTPAGMMTQWLPVYQMPVEAVEQAIATFVAVFPHAMLYSGIGEEFILLGSREPIDMDRLFGRFPADGPARRDLEGIGVRSPAALGVRVVLTPAGLRRDYAGKRTISDQRNDLDHMFLAPVPLATVPYDPREVLAWLRAGAPRMAQAVEPGLLRRRPSR